MKIIVGEGLKEAENYTGLFAREAELTEDLRDMTFQMIGEQLAKQFGIKDGIVELSEIIFSVKWKTK